MMPSRSTPNLQAARENKNHTPSIYSYLHSQSGLNFAPVTAVPTRDNESPPPAPPVRDSSSLKSVKYGPGHEKFPSWPVPAVAEAPQVLRGPPSGGSHRSKSWTDHTNYPKEKVVTYTRPYMKRQHSAMQQKLKTVMERCEKILPESYEIDKINDRLYLPRVDREGKALGDMEYMVPSPPERDLNKPNLTQADLEEYARSYHDAAISKYCQYSGSLKGSLSHLTQADLEEYTRSYEEALSHQHQKQPSYAQSEGYHSYVSSTDSTSTPFLDRLRRDSEAVANVARASSNWDELSVQESNNIRHEGRDSVVTTSSGSASSSETLKWHGSMSDVSVASSSCTHLANSSTSSISKQLIAHSARVQTPQRHHSESILYIGSDSQDGWKDKEKRNNSANKLKLFPVNTYTVQPSEQQQEHNHRLTSLSSQSSLSVAERISELEKQQKYSYLDPDKRHRVPDPTLKAIQKKALLSFYERHHSNSNKSNPWRSEPQLAQSQPAFTAVPQPPPRITVQTPSRRASSASDYASGNNSRRSSLSSTRESRNSDVKITPRHQHSNSCGSLSTDLLGPVIVGPSISIDDWIPSKPPERPPKNPHLRTLFQDQRVPSPDLPPPSPPTVLEDEVFHCDEPLPPPPPELNGSDWQEEFNERLKENTTKHQFAVPQVGSHNRSKDVEFAKSFVNENKADTLTRQTPGLPDRISIKYASSHSIKEHPSFNMFDKVNEGKQYPHDSSDKMKSPSANNSKHPEHIMGFPNQRGYAERSSTRYPTTHKLVLNGNVAVSQKVVNGISDQYRAEPLRPHMNVQSEVRNGQRSSIAEGSARDVPPPLQPRQMRINQSMRARMPEKRPADMISRNSPPRYEKGKPLQYTMSQSKASYLASRRERDRILPDPDSGVYKRTMSPNGHSITSDSTSESQRVNTREKIWSSRTNKDATILKNNANLIRRASMTEKTNKNGTLLSLHCKEKEEMKKPHLVLPDVLPVKEKLLPPRSQQCYPQPDSVKVQKALPRSPPKYESPPSSPTKSPSRNSPFMPLRNTVLSSPLKITTNVPSPSSSPQSESITNRISPPMSDSSTTSSSPLSSICSSSSQTSLASSTVISTSPQNSKISSPLRTSPASYSPLSTAVPHSPLRTSPPQLRHSPLKSTPSPSFIRSSPMISTSTNTPLHHSPSTSPLHSPRTSVGLLSSPVQSPKQIDYEQPQVLEGLQMIQRTEVILRVNICTTDASSQTEKEELPATPLPTRRKLQEEIDCEKLSQDLIKQLSPSDRLKDILIPGPDHKKPTDYVSGLFRPDVTSRARPANSPFRSRTTTPNCSPPPSMTLAAISNNLTMNKNCDSQSTSMVPKLEPSSPLSATSTYFTTSEPKAKLLTRFSQDLNQYNIVKDTKDLNQKKVELVNRLDRKLEVLRSEQLVVSEECRVNEELGENVNAHINRLARPQEAAKFRLHVEEIGKITSLLLGLSGRLARAENALMGMSDDHPEKSILETKRDKLKDQLEEAKKLKESIDRRSISVSNILYKYLNSDEYADYDHFINMKAKLIMDSREIADKIKLGEEQLFALKETLNTID